MKIPQFLFRAGSFETSAVNEAERTVDLSLSSEDPYERSFGVEILDHTNGGCDLSRMNAGAPLLWSHDKTKHLGTIISAKIEGGKLRVKAKIGENADAEDRWKDIKSGVLRNASVGYEITSMKKEGKTKEGTPVFRCGFMPFEGSLLTIPADCTVGIGRGLIASDLQKEIDTGEEKSETQATRNNSMAATPEEIEAEKQKIEVVREAARKEGQAAEQQRVAGIQERQAHFREKGLGGRKIDTDELAAQFIREGKTPRDFQDAVVNGNFKDAKPVETIVQELGMNKKEKSDFSFLRAIYNLGTGRGLSGLEREASEAHAKLVGKECGPNSFYVPVDIMRGSAFGRGISQEQLRAMQFANEQTRALFSNVYSGAGAFVGTDLIPSLIELLRNQMYVVQMGARSISGLRGNVAFPRQSGGATASWLAEDSTITATQQVVGQLNLTPHKLAAATAFTEQLAMQTSIDAENFVRQDLMAVTAIARDLAAINGSGVSGEPQGIITTGSLSTNVTLSAAQSMTYANAVAFETNVALNNAAQGKLGYMTTPTVRGNAKLIAEISAANSNPVWKNGMVNGYPAMATNQVPTAQGVIFGNWDDLLLADWAESSFFVDPFSLSLQGQIRVINRLYCDNGIRHTKSFAIGTL